jgi:hypothetical protein
MEWPFAGHSQALPSAPGLELDLQFLELVIPPHRHHENRPLAAIVVSFRSK